MVWDFLSQSFIERIHNVDLEQDSEVGDVTFQFDLPNDTCSYVLIATISFFDDNAEYNKHAPLCTSAGSWVSIG